MFDTSRRPEWGPQEQQYFARRVALDYRWSNTGYAFLYALVFWFGGFGLHPAHGTGPAWPLLTVGGLACLGYSYRAWRGWRLRWGQEAVGVPASKADETGDGDVWPPAPRPGA